MLRCLVLALVVVSWLPAQAALFSVDSTSDVSDASAGDGVCDDGGGSCTLRAAIEEANAFAGEDHIALPAGTYALTQGELSVTDDLRLAGAGADVTTIDGDASDRVLSVSVATTTLTLSDVTLTNGLIFGDGGGLLVTDATVDMVDCTVDGNMSDNLGGGIMCLDGTLTVTNSTISNNSASGLGFETGAAIGVDGCTLTVTNSTLSGNTSQLGSVIDGFDGTTTLSGVTVAGNLLNSARALADLPGTIANSIVADNLAGNCEASSAWISLGHNLDDDGSCPFAATGDLSNVANALIGSLQNNGGATETHAVLVGSPAIDAGNASSCLGRDQRGSCRADGDAVGGVVCDIGAYEGGGSCTGVTQPIEITLTYSAPVQEFGPVCCGLGSLPGTVDLVVEYEGLPATPDLVDLDDVLSASISYGDATMTEADFTSFHLTTDAIGRPTALTWMTNPITTGTTLNVQTINNDFALTVAGTDISSGQPFQYRYTEAQSVGLPVPALSPSGRRGVALLILALGVGLSRRRVWNRSTLEQ